MNKVAIVINGAGGVGKDTLCELAAKHFKVMNISSITPIKEIAALCGWDGRKDDRACRQITSGEDVEHHRYVHPFQNTVLHHIRCALQDFFCRLKHEPNRTEKLLTVVDQQLCCTQQHGGMEIVTAGVHIAIF